MDDPLTGPKIFAELNLANDFYLVPNDYAMKDNTKTTFFEAILLANKQPVEYEKSVPVQIKYRKESKSKDNLIGKLITS